MNTMKFNNNLVYKCYSVGLKDMLISVGHVMLGEGRNEKYNKTCWLFYKTDELQTSLSLWSNNSASKKCAELAQKLEGSPKSALNKRRKS